MYKPYNPTDCCVPVADKRSVVSCLRVDQWDRLKSDAILILYDIQILEL